MMNDADDLMSFFRDAVYRNGNDNYTPADELDNMYREYMEYIEELKAEGYKIMRNEKGKHKVIKGDT